MSLPLSKILFGRNSPLGFAGALWAHRELLWQFSIRNVELRHKGSHLGLVWSVLNPILMMGLYVFVFGFIFKGHFGVLPNESRIDYALGIFLGLTLFQLLAETLGGAPLVIVGNPNFVKKVVFPLEILPAASVMASCFHMLVALAMVLLGAALLGSGLTMRILWLPFILAPLVFLSLGVAWLLAAAGVFFRDINYLVAFITMVVMYASALFYPPSMIPPAAWSFLRFNPILLAVELARNCVLWDRPLNGAHLLYLVAVSFFTCIGGYFLFRKAAPVFADVL